MSLPDLMKRATRSPWWAWLPGMMFYGTMMDGTRYEGRVIQVSSKKVRVFNLTTKKMLTFEKEYFVAEPVLEDYPTVQGALLKLVRTAWKSPLAFLEPMARNSWQVMSDHDGDLNCIGRGLGRVEKRTEEELDAASQYAQALALIDALESAPPPETATSPLAS